MARRLQQLETTNVAVPDALILIKDRTSGYLEDKSITVRNLFSELIYNSEVSISPLVGQIPRLVDSGVGTPALPAISGRLLTDLTAESGALPVGSGTVQGVVSLSSKLNLNSGEQEGIAATPSAIRQLDINKPNSKSTESITGLWSFSKHLKTRSIEASTLDLTLGTLKGGDTFGNLTITGGSGLGGSVFFIPNNNTNVKMELTKDGLLNVKGNIIANTPTDKSHVVIKSYTDNLITELQDDVRLVHTSGDESIAGIKTFTDKTSFSEGLDSKSPITVSQTIGIASLGLSQYPSRGSVLFFESSTGKENNRALYSGGDTSNAPVWVKGVSTFDIFHRGFMGEFARLDAGSLATLTIDKFALKQAKALIEAKWTFVESDNAITIKPKELSGSSFILFSNQDDTQLSLIGSNGVNTNLTIKSINDNIDLLTPKGIVSVNGDRVLTVDDQGTGKGLDSDTVDKLHAHQFIRSDVDDVVSGTKTFKDSIIFETDLLEYNSKYLPEVESDTLAYLRTFRSSPSVTWNETVRGETYTLSANGTSKANEIFSLNSKGSGYIAGNLIWNAKNANNDKSPWTASSLVSKTATISSKLVVLGQTELNKVLVTGKTQIAHPTENSSIIIGGTSTNKNASIELLSNLEEGGFVEYNSSNKNLQFGTLLGGKNTISLAINSLTLNTTFSGSVFTDSKQHSAGNAFTRRDFVTENYLPLLGGSVRGVITATSFEATSNSVGFNRKGASNQGLSLRDDNKSYLGGDGSKGAVVIRPQGITTITSNTIFNANGTITAATDAINDNELPRLCQVKTADNLRSLKDGDTFTGEMVFNKQPHFKNEDGILLNTTSKTTGTSEGSFRYNELDREFEGFVDNEWRPIAGGAGVHWLETSKNTLAEVGFGYLISSPNLVITLPTGRLGDVIGVGDYNGKDYGCVVTSKTNIMGLPEDFTFKVQNANLIFTYVDTTVGWILSQGFGESDAPQAIANKRRATGVKGRTEFGLPNNGSETVDVWYNGLKLDPVKDYSVNQETEIITLTKPVSNSEDVLEFYAWNQALIIDAKDIMYTGELTTEITSTLTMQQAIDARAPNKNLLINGDLSVNQRGVFSVSLPTESGEFIVDRWTVWGTSGVASVQPSFTTQEYPYQYIKLEKRFKGSLTQCVELGSVGVAKDLSLSFDLRATGGDLCEVYKMEALLYWADSTGTSTSQKVSEIVELPMESSDSFLKIKVALLNLPAPIAGTTMLIVTLKLPKEFDTGRSISVGCVKLEHSSIATAFTPDLAQDTLTQCQRYYQTVRVSGSGFNLKQYQTYYRDVNINFITSMRVIPTCTLLGPVRLSDEDITAVYLGGFCVGSSLVLNSAGVSFQGYVADAEL